MRNTQFLADLNAAQAALTAGDVDGYIQHMRRAYRMPPGPTLPTAQDHKLFEQVNTDMAIQEILAAHQGRNDLDSVARTWFEFNPVHDRDLPTLVWEVITHDCLTPEAERDEVAWAWTKPEFPQANLSRGQWVKMLRRVGYLDDRPELGRAGTPVDVAWRAALPTGSRGLAWTTDLDRARWFSRRLTDREPLPIFEIHDVPADRVLARFDTRDESEVVLNLSRSDTTRLTTVD